MTYRGGRERSPSPSPFGGGGDRDDRRLGTRDGGAFDGVVPRRGSGVGGPSRHSRKRPAGDRDDGVRSIGKAFAVASSGAFLGRRASGRRGGRSPGGGRRPPSRGRRRSSAGDYDPRDSDFFADEVGRKGRRRTACDSPQFTISTEPGRSRTPRRDRGPGGRRTSGDFALPAGHVLSPRADAWLTLALSSAVALASLGVGGGGRPSAARRGALAGTSLVLVLGLAASASYRYRPARRGLTSALGSVADVDPRLRVVTAELVLAIAVLAAQLAVDSALLSPSSGLALAGGGDVWDANLYLSAWSATASAAFVAADAATSRDPAGSHPAECTASDPVGRGYVLLFLASAGLAGCALAVPPGGGGGGTGAALVFGGLGMLFPLLRAGLGYLESRLRDEMRRGLRHFGSANVHKGLISGLLSLASLVCFAVNAHFLATADASRGGTVGLLVVPPGPRPYNVIFASWLCLFASLYLCVRHIELYFVPGSRQIVLYAPSPTSRRKNKAKGFHFSSASSRGSTAQTSRIASDIESAFGDSAGYIYTTPMVEDDALTVDQSIFTINTAPPPHAGGGRYDMRPPVEADPDEYGPEGQEPPEERAMTEYESRQSLRSGPDPIEVIDSRPQAQYESSDDLLRTSNSRSADPLEMIDSRAQAPYSSSEDNLRTSNSTNQSNLDPSDANLGQQYRKRSVHADDIPPLNGSQWDKSGYSPSLGSDPYVPVAKSRSGRSRSASRSSFPANPSNSLDKSRGHSHRDVDGSEMSASNPGTSYSSGSSVTDMSNPTTQDPSQYSGPSSRSSFRTEEYASRDSSRSSSRGDMKRQSASRRRDEDRVSSYPSPKNGPPPPNRFASWSAPVIHEEMSADANVPVHSISLDNLSVVSEPTFFDPDEGLGGRGKDSIRHNNVSSSARRQSYHEWSNSDVTQDNDNNNGALRQSAVDTMVMEALRQAQVARELASADGTEWSSPADAAEALRQTQAVHQSPGLTPPFAFVPQTSPLHPPPRTMAMPTSRRTHLSGHSSRSGGRGSVRSFYSHSHSADDENASAYDC